MKILLVNYRFFISGGPEKYMFNIKKVLEENGHEVIPFSIHSYKNVETDYSKYFVEPIGGREAVYFKDIKKTPKTVWQLLTRSIYSFEVKRAIKKVIKETAPDVVYIIHFVNKLSPSVISGAKQLGVPVVLRLSDYFLLCPRFDFVYNNKVCEDCLTQGYLTCIKRGCVQNSKFASIVRVFSMKVHKWLRIYDDVDAFITPSEFLREKIVSNGFSDCKSFCVPTFTVSKSRVIEDNVGSYGLYFGRLVPEKGVETLIKAYEKLPNKKLKIVGDNSTIEGQRLKKYVENNRINNIEFLGFKHGDALEKIICDARFTVIPSIWYDNLPNTALESFRYYKPIIASNLGSLPEIVVNGTNGYLFEAGNVSDLVNKIKLFDNDNEVKRMGMNGYLYLNDKFSLDKHYGKLMEIFTEVCGTNTYSNRFKGTDNRC